MGLFDECGAGFGGKMRWWKLWHIIRLLCSNLFVITLLQTVGRNPLAYSMESLIMLKSSVPLFNGIIIVVFMRKAIQMVGNISHLGSGDYLYNMYFEFSFIGIILDSLIHLMGNSCVLAVLLRWWIIRIIIIELLPDSYRSMHGSSRKWLWQRQ